MTEACQATGGNKAKQRFCLQINEALLRGFASSLNPVHLAGWTGFIFSPFPSRFNEQQTNFLFIMIFLYFCGRRMGETMRGWQTNGGRL